MVTLKRDRKSKDCWLITTTDSEGFHRQLTITFDDMRELLRLWVEEVMQEHVANAIGLFLVKKPSAYVC